MKGVYYIKALIVYSVQMYNVCYINGLGIIRLINNKLQF